MYFGLKASEVCLEYF